MGTSDRRPYLSATSLTQGLLDQCQDNLTGKLEMVCIITGFADPYGTLVLSDRAKYIKLPGSTYSRFCEPRATFPVISKSIGDWLSSQLEMSSCDIEINNSDGKYNELLPGGRNYNGFINREVEILVGIGEDGDSYQRIFKGKITKIGGYERSKKSFKIHAMNRFDSLNVDIPPRVFLKGTGAGEFEYLDDEMIGKGIPIIYGDYTVNLRKVKVVSPDDPLIQLVQEASQVPAFVVNGRDFLVNKSITDPDTGEPDPDVGSVPVMLLVSDNALSFFDTSTVLMHRGDKYYIFASSDITIIPATDNRAFQITQTNLMVGEDGTEPWIYADGDEFFVAVKGRTFPSYSLWNPVRQVEFLLKEYGGVIEADFGTYWAFWTLMLETKGTHSRIWLQDSQKLLEYCLSVFEQVRIEMFIDGEDKLALHGMYFEGFNFDPDYSLKNWDLIKDTANPRLDDTAIFNAAKADYGYCPAINENNFSTPIYVNQTAIDQMSNKITKTIVFPNLYNESDVVYQLTEMLRIAPYIEYLECSLTSRSLLLDIGDQISLNINIGGINFVSYIDDDGNEKLFTDKVTGIIRSIGYDPKGLSIPVKIWLLQMISFPDSLKTDVQGKVTGYDVVITQEV